VTVCSVWGNPAVFIRLYTGFVIRRSILDLPNRGIPRPGTDHYIMPLTSPKEDPISVLI
jgi:hypothetical protein